ERIVIGNVHVQIHPQYLAVEIVEILGIRLFNLIPSRPKNSLWSVKSEACPGVPASSLIFTTNLGLSQDPMLIRLTFYNIKPDTILSKGFIIKVDIGIVVWVWMNDHRL